MKSLIMLAVLCLGFLSLGCYSQRIVQTRIVIEETMTDAGPVYFINPEQVYGDLRRAESIFKPANVKFRVTCIELKPRKTSIWCYVDAEMHWQLSVYYMDPTSTIPPCFAGNATAKSTPRLVKKSWTSPIIA
jgi:hypothetical protein